MKSLLKRFREPSTFAALGTLLALFGINIDPGLIQQVSTGAGALAAVVGILAKERGSD